MTDKKIRVFTTPTCAYCIVLKKWLEEKGVDYEEIDITQHEEEQERMVEKTGQVGVPVTEIEGEMVVGFEKDKIAQLLGIKE